MNNQPIGILDSGAGGLTIWKEIVKELPKESTIYIADSQNCPYGNKSELEIYRLASRLVQFLIQKNAKLIVVACNTITVSCLDKLREDFPDIPIVGTVPVIKTASESSKAKKIGVLSTKRTAESDYQKNLIQKFASDCKVISVGTEELVPLVEEQRLKGAEAQSILREVLQPFIDAKVDTLVLGCSHFPFLRQEIQRCIGSKIKILDSGEAVARQVKRVLVQNQALASDEKSVHSFITTGDPHVFSEILASIGYNNQELRIQNLEL